MLLGGGGGRREWCCREGKQVCGAAGRHGVAQADSVLMVGRFGSASKD